MSAPRLAFIRSAPGFLPDIPPLAEDRPCWHWCPPAHQPAPRDQFWRHKGPAPAYRHCFSLPLLLAHFVVAAVWHAPKRQRRICSTELSATPGQRLAHRLRCVRQQAIRAADLEANLVRIQLTEFSPSISSPEFVQKWAEMRISSGMR